MFISKVIIPVAFSAAFVAPLALAQTTPGTTTTIQAVPATVESQTTTTIGQISEMSPDALIISTGNAAAPIRYSSSASTIFVDETGRSVSRELVTTGLPVTVHYSRAGDRLVADRVIVRRQTSTTTAAPTVIERNTTVTAPPVVVEKPVYVDRPVAVEKKVYVDRPVAVEKKVFVDRPVVVEKQVPVIVEKEVPVVVPAPVAVKKTTTTTTTTKKEDKGLFD